MFVFLLDIVPTLLLLRWPGRCVCVPRLLDHVVVYFYLLVRIGSPIIGIAHIQQSTAATSGTATTTNGIGTMSDADDRIGVVVVVVVRPILVK